MRVMNIGVNNKVVANNRLATSGSKKSNTNPSFGTRVYKATFEEFFDGYYRSSSNQKTFKTLMQSAISAKFANIDGMVKKHFDPDSYYSVMSGLIKNKEPYKKLNNISYNSPICLVSVGKVPLVTVINFGYQGNFLDLLFGEVTQDTRICFHGIGNDRNKIICLGCDNNGKHTKTLSSDGLGTLMAGINLQNL